MILSACWTASALGVGNQATLENFLAHRAPGLRETEGDIPGRRIWFGHIDAELPEINRPEFAIRANRLLALAVANMPGLKALIARYGASRVGLVLGASNTGVDEAQRCVDRALDSAIDLDGLCFAYQGLGTPSLYLKSALGLEGPAYTVSTACSSSTKAFGAARRLIEKGVCDAVIVGGVDGRCRFALNGFHALGALSAGRCRPLSPDRDGINLGEAVALFALEREADAVVREGVPVRLLGVGESSDAYHATSPDPDGVGAETAMRAALADARLKPEEIDYINLHGTGTQANDAMETRAVMRVFGSMERAESTKSLTGHCLGAAGAVEAALCWLLISSGRRQAALSNSFAFGGSNASVVLAR